MFRNNMIFSQIFDIRENKKYNIKDCNNPYTFEIHFFNIRLIPSFFNYAISYPYIKIPYGWTSQEEAEEYRDILRSSLIRNEPHILFCLYDNVLGYSYLKDFYYSFETALFFVKRRNPNFTNTYINYYISDKDKPDSLESSVDWTSDTYILPKLIADFRLKLED